MTYVAMLRGRRVLTRYAIFLLCGLAIALAIIFSEHSGHVHVETSGTGNHRIPFGVIVGMTALAMYFIVAVLGANLDAEYRSAAIAWTRPISRYRIALQYFGIDAGAAVIAWTMAILGSLFIFAILGTLRYIVIDQNIGSDVALLIAVGVMWYGLVVFVASLVPGRGNVVVWASWAYALFVPSLTLIRLPPAGHAITVALNWLDPLTYIGSMNGGGYSDARGIIPGGQPEHAAIALAIGIVAIVAGTRIWATREVVA